MEIAMWVLNGILAAALLMAGGMKAVSSKEKLAASGMAWVEDFQPSTIRLIGIAEVLGAIGLIVPALTDIVPVLTPIAAGLLALIMVGAAVVHVRRNEKPGPSAVLAVLLLASSVLSTLVLFS